MRVLLYPHSARAFTSALIGHLYELSQEHDVYLLVEPLPEAYQDLLRRRDLFPRLKNVVTINGLGFSATALLANNHGWMQLAEDAIAKTKPDLVMSENDMSSVFDMYLLRAAKRRGLPRLTAQGMNQFPDEQFRRWAELMATHPGGKAAGGLRRLFYASKFHLRKGLGHAFVHYVLPTFIGQSPLIGRSSYIKRSGAPGMRDSQLHLVFCPQQLENFLKSGVHANRLAVLPHPLQRVPYEAFFPDADVHVSQGPQALVLLASSQQGFDRNTSTLISVERRRALRLAAIQTLQETLPTWQISIKAHPDFGTIEEVRKYLDVVGSKVKVVDPRQLLEPLILSSDLVIDLPPASSSALLTAASDRRRIPVISADLDRDVLGDHYAGWPGIDYVTTSELLKSVLSKVADGTYLRPQGSPFACDAPEFKSTNDAVRHLLGSMN